ncbi:hypothetical protein [Brucella thiophenivorans]|uniref:Uncharacterized protein n=1 Tax=Brucella thiophenivorans TaxID=571255 RepID=A0A256FU19_9HYPH|nr:hypothetical protein [Brucella thiophenivorans]OYR18238.1 hypothetical protein CEV31_4250 [Brucella thiophenivorans]
MASQQENASFRQSKSQIINSCADEARDFDTFRSKLAEQGVLVKLVIRERQNVEVGKPTKHRAVSFTDLDDHAGFAGQDIDLSAHVLISKFGEPKQDWYQTPGYYEEWQEQKELFPNLDKADKDAASQYAENNQEHVQLARAQEMIDRPEQVPDEIDQFTYYDTLEKIDADLEGPNSDFGVYSIWTQAQSSDLATSKLQLDKSLNSRAMKRYERGARFGLYKEAREKKDLENGFKAQQVSSKAYALNEDRKTMIFLASEKKKLDGLLAETKPDTPERKFVVEQIALLEMKARYAKFASEFRSSEINAVFKAQGKALTASNVREVWLDFKSQAKRDWTEAFSGKAAAVRAYREMREDNKLIVAKTLKYAMTNIKPKEPMRFEAWLHQQEMTPHAVAALISVERQRFSPEEQIQQLDQHLIRKADVERKKVSVEVMIDGPVQESEGTPNRDINTLKLAEKSHAIYSADDNLLRDFETTFTFQKKPLSDEKIASIGSDVSGKLYGDKPLELSINDIRSRLTDERYARLEYTPDEMRSHDEYMSEVENLEALERAEYNKDPHFHDYHESDEKQWGQTYGEYLETRGLVDQDPMQSQNTERLETLDNLDLSDPAVIQKIDTEYAAVAGNTIEMHPLGLGSDEFDLEGHNEAVQSGFGDPEYQIEIIKKARDIEQKQEKQDSKVPVADAQINNALNKNTKQQGERIARDATHERVEENVENRNEAKEKSAARKLVKEQEQRATELKESKAHGKKPVLKLVKPL